MGVPRRVIASSVVVGFMAGLASLVVVLQSDHVRDTTSAVVFGPGIGWAFVAAGAVAWWRRPQNRLGWLMAAVGFAWFAGALAVADEYPLFLVGALLSALPYGLLVHMLLAVPEGRLTGRLDRAVVGVTYVSCTLVQWLPLLLFDTRRLDCDCPRQSLLVPVDSDTERVVFTIQAALAVLVVAGLVALRIPPSGRGAEESASVPPEALPARA